MVALLTSERLNVLVLLDDERLARATRDDLVRDKLIREENVLFVTEGFSGTVPSEADTEDLLDPAVYDFLVKESYEAELKGKALSPNPSIPRIAKRYEDAFQRVGLQFHKTRPARLLLRLMATDPGRIMSSVSADRFTRLFEKIAKQQEKHSRRKGEPFA